jgi:hypothetical protein
MGRPRSAIDKTTNLPVTVLAGNMAGPIQLHAKKGDAAGAKTVGMLPAYFAIEKAEPITAATTAANVTISLPAYNGLAAVPDITAVTKYTVYGQDRPVVMTLAAAQAANCVIGIFGFPIDDAASELN